MENTIIIIGAGIAGLSAGCYSRMNGYRTDIFEMHDKPGGLCTAWERKGYTIDGCLHWLVGSAPDSSLHPLWREVGAIQGKQIINLDEFYQVEGADGRPFRLYTDIDRLEQHMKEISPDDASFISEVASAVRRFSRFDMPVSKAPELYTVADNLRMLFSMLPFLSSLRKWNRITIKDFALRFKSQLLSEAFLIMWPVQFSAVAMIMTLAWMNRKDAGYVIGGSMEISRSMEKRYLSLGGRINYRSRVTRILTEKGRAVGVRLDDGSEHRADCVISAADGHATIFDLLEGKYLDNKIRGYYETMPIFQPLVYVGLGVNRSFEDAPKLISGMVLRLDKPLRIGQKEHHMLHVSLHNFDNSLAPSNKTVVTAMMESDYLFWESLHGDTARYKAEKERIANDVVNILDKRFAGLAGQVEMRDVATPITFNRYTGNWQGSFEGWLATPRTMMMRMKKTLPGLDNFYMAGQWVQPGGGLPSGLMTGRHVIQMLCKRDGRGFVTATPD